MISGGRRTKGIMKVNNKETPLVSIITVSYNSEKYIEETIQSVISQNYNNFEYIIIDGGSTDSTVDILKKYDNDIDYWVSEKDDGMYHAINKAIEISMGSIWSSLNSDDTFVNSNIITSFVSFFKESSFQYDLVWGDVLIERHGKTMRRRLFSVDYETFLADEICTFIPQPGAFHTKFLVEKNGMFNTNYRYCADYDFFLRTLKNSKVKHINTVSTKFRRHEDCLSIAQMDVMDKENLDVVASYKKPLSFFNFIRIKLKLSIYRTHYYILNIHLVLNHLFYLIVHKKKV